jgi:sugar fermentation stimulation protein A
MMGLLKKDNKVWITESDNINRKLKYTLQIIEDKGKKIGINTHLTNKIVDEALGNNIIKEFSKNSIVEREKKFGENSRFDFLISEKNKKSFVEVKNVTLSRKNNIAEFPDSITSRGLKHINDLILAMKRGYNSYLLYVIQREDCDRFRIAKDIDPEYYKLLTIGLKNNLKILCYDCKFSPKGIKLNSQVKLHLNE